MKKLPDLPKITKLPNEFKFCKICMGKIMLSKDSYVHVVDFKLGEFFTEGYYHNNCWHRALHRQTVDKMMNDLKGVLGGISPNYNGV